MCLLTLEHAGLHEYSMGKTWLGSAAGEKDLCLRAQSKFPALIQLQCSSEVREQVFSMTPPPPQDATLALLAHLYQCWKVG